jgi:hypothetical protein
MQSYWLRKQKVIPLGFKGINRLVNYDSTLVLATDLIYELVKKYWDLKTQQNEWNPTNFIAQYQWNQTSLQHL